MKIGVTGASGFVGNAVWRSLTQRGWDACRLVRHPAPGTTDRLFDLSLRSTIAECTRELDLIIHCAGAVGASSCGNDSEFYRTNTEAVRTLFESSIKSGVQRILLCSSAAVYAPSKDKLSETNQTAPGDAYGMSKLFAEQIAAEYSPNIETVVLRLFFPYGPGQRSERLVPRLIRMILDNRPITLANGTGPRLSLIHIDDLTTFVVQVLQRWQPAVINVGGKRSVTVKALAEFIARTLGASLNVEVTEADVPNFIADVSKAESLFGAMRETGVERGLQLLLGEFPFSHADVSGV